MTLGNKHRKLPQIRGAVAGFILHIVLLLFIYIMQANVMPFFDWPAVPLLLPAAAVAVSMFEGASRGAVLGLVAGALCDISFLDPISKFMLLLTLLCMIIGTLTDRIVARGFIPYLVIAIISLMICSLVQLFVPLAFDGARSDALFRTALQEIIITVPFTIIIYPLAKAAARGRLKSL